MKKEKIIRLVIFLCAIALIGYSLYQLYLIYAVYNVGTSEYGQLSQYVTVEDDNAVVEEPAKELSEKDASIIEETPTSQEGEGTKEEDKEQTISVETRLKEAGIPRMTIDWESLKKTNPDLVGWLYMPGLGLSYPVVQGEDDDYYLHHTFEGEPNNNGCIFANSESNGDFTDYNTFLYGHNMRNGSMFGVLKNYYKKEKTIQSNPCFYIYTEDASYKYKVFSFHKAKPRSETYRIPEDIAGYAIYLKKIKELNISDNEDLLANQKEAMADKTMVTLSTCDGSGSNKQRFAVHGYLSDKVDN